MCGETAPEGCISSLKSAFKCIFNESFCCVVMNLCILRLWLTFSTLGARMFWVWTWEGPGNGGCRGLAGSPLRSTADTLGGVRQDKGEERGRRGREAGEERGEGPKLGPGDTIERGRPNCPGQREGDERRGEIATVGRSGLPAGGLWTTKATVWVSRTFTDPTSAD